MTQGELMVSPDIKSLLRTKGDNEIITATSPLAMGRGNKRGILTESKWKLNWDEKVFDFMMCRRITRFNTEYMMPSEVPDRQKREMRKYGSELFGIKPFRGLRLYGSRDRETLILASMGGEKRLFSNEQDAEVWGMQLGKEQMTTKVISPKTVKDKLGVKKTIPQVLRVAYENDYSIRTEILQLVEQVSAGISALKRLKTLKQRGLSQDYLNYILNSSHGFRELSEEAASLLFNE